MKNWSYEKTGTFIWVLQWRRTKEILKNMTKYWLYAPGEDATNGMNFMPPGNYGQVWDAIGIKSAHRPREYQK